MQLEISTPLQDRGLQTICELGTGPQVSSLWANTVVLHVAKITVLPQKSPLPVPCRSVMQGSCGGGDDALCADRVVTSSVFFSMVSSLWDWPNHWFTMSTSNTRRVHLDGPNNRASTGTEARGPWVPTQLLSMAKF